MVELVVTGGLLGLSVVLFGFHFYLNQIGKTTFEYMIPVEEGEGSRPVPPPAAF